MNVLAKIAATAATLALMLPGAALAGNGHGHAPGESGTPGKTGAPGQVCKGLKVKGKKTPEQRAAYKQCIKDAVAKRKADNHAKANDDADDDDATENDTDDDHGKKKHDTEDDD